jgi:hypothetical protein
LKYIFLARNNISATEVCEEAKYYSNSQFGKSLPFFEKSIT